MENETLTDLLFDVRGRTFLLAGGAGGLGGVLAAAKSYITDQYMKMVMSDPKLSAFANRAN